MAGSYSHVTTDAGNLRSTESFLDFIDDRDDAYEAVEEMYGMIWWLAAEIESGDYELARAIVAQAERGYRHGLTFARAANRLAEGTPE